MSIFGLIIGFCFAMCVGLFSNTKEVEDYTKEIVSIEDTTTTNGEFSLGFGVINEEPSYIVYQEQDGGYTMEDYPASLTTVFECSDPKVVKFETVPTMSIWLGVAVDSLLPRYEIHVPCDTIKKNFVLGPQQAVTE